MTSRADQVRGRSTLPIQVIGTPQSAAVRYRLYAHEYAANFADCRAEVPVGDIIRRLVAHRDRYARVAQAVGAPWCAVALIHHMEADGNFSCHLHNGDPLTHRTVHVPAGRPAAGEPPFSWEASAEDALRLAEWERVTEGWPLPRVLYQLEAYNGWGYRKPRHPRSPYLWAGSNLEGPGKYTSDGRYDPRAVSEQAGCATLLRELVDQGFVKLPQ
jgi:lysozyme family protein